MENKENNKEYLGDQECLFEYAKQKGIHLDYCYLGKEVVGIYADLGGYQIILNSNVDHEKQDKALHLLIEHHNSEWQGIERCVKKMDLVMLDKIDREVKQIEQSIIDIFLGSLFRRKSQSSSI